MTVRVKQNYVPAFWDELFSDTSFNSFFNERSISTPAVNVIEDDKEFVIEVAAPGLDKEDFKIGVEDDMLSISSEKKVGKDESKSKYMRREFSYNSFRRRFQLPDSVLQDTISATHRQGILSIHLPKKEEEIKKGPMDIQIS